MERNIFVVFGIIMLNLLLLLPSVCAGKAMTDSADTTLSLTISQVKAVLIRQLSPVDIKDMINRSRDKGATGYKLNYYSHDKMGWSIDDSKGREVISVIFIFINQHAKEGTYFVPLMSFNDAKEIHNWHREVLSGYFKQIGNNKYDIGDNCTAFLELLKGTNGTGRTKITIKCQ